MELESGTPYSGTPYSQGTRHSYVAIQYPALVEHTRLRSSDMTRLRRETSGFGYRPVVSVVLPVYDPKREWLERALDSVLAQVYPEWELIAVDDGSTGEHVREVLSRYERLDERIKVIHMERNSGISAASNAGLAASTGEFVALLDHDDELPPDAVFEVVKLLQDHPEADLVYSDVDKIDEDGTRSDPNFKPGWSPDLLLSSNYVGHLAVYRRTILEDIGGFRSEFDGCQDYDLVLRFTERTENVFHVPKVLYHWRTVAGSVALSPTNKDYIREKAHRALREALERRGLDGEVEDGLLPNRFHVKLTVRGEPKVSVIVPTRDNVSLLKNCLQSIEDRTGYGNYEVLVVDNESRDPATVEYLASIPYQVVRFEGEFNFSRINNAAAREATGEYLLFLNDDTEVISGGWMEEMLRHAQREEVGAVGAKLLYPDGRIQHAGVLTGVGHPWVPAVATHSHQRFPPGSSGYVGAVKVVRNYSAVTAACMMVRRSVFEEVGGFDEILRVAYNDVDLCLRMRERGYLMVYTPYAELYHHESASRGLGGTTQEAVYMRKRWRETLDRDPYYNPNLSLGSDYNLRADLLRPRLLRGREPEPAQDPRLMDPEEFGEYVRARRLSARDSRSHSLAPPLSYKATGNGR